jgi:hypothetical protein
MSRNRWLIAAILLAVLGIYPLVNEGVHKPCRALESRVARVSLEDSNIAKILGAAVTQKLWGLGGGLLAEEYAKQKHPDIPPALTCYGVYWYSVFDRPWLQNETARILGP